VYKLKQLLLQHCPKLFLWEITRSNSPKIGQLKKKRK